MTIMIRILTDFPLNIFSVADLRAFLESAGWGDAACEPLTGDASAR